MVYKTSLLFVRPLDVKSFKERSDDIAATLAARRLLYMSIHFKSIIHFLGHERSLDKNFEHNVATDTD
jgi:hypothetical protein